MSKLEQTISLVNFTMDTLFKSIKDIPTICSIIQMNLGKTKYNYSVLERNYKDIVPQLSLDELESLVATLDDAYYNSSEPIVSDSVYDYIREYAEQNQSVKGKTKAKIGAPVRGEKVKLPIHLGSMDKIKLGSNDLKNFFTTYKNKKCISEKLDGISFLLDFSNPKEPKAYTRGDSELAQDKTYILDYIKTPLVRDGGYIRGELIISKNNWETIKDQGKNARNYVSGIINKKTIDKTMFKHIDFVAYEYYNPTTGDLAVEEQFKKLKQLGFRVANYKVLDITVDQLVEQLIQFREQSSYIIDGIIIADTGIHKRNTSGNPKYAKAFKDETQMESGETTVLDIEWTPSKDGKLKPVLLLKPINLGGVTISRATGNNASFIVNQGIGKQAIVKIIRSGDVIPKVIGVTKPVQPALPNEFQYKWDANHTDIILEDQENNSTMKIKQIDHFITTIGAEHMKIGTVTKAFESGAITNIADLFTLSKAKLLKVDGIKDKSAEKILGSLQKALSQVDIVTFISGLPCFSGLGKKRLQLIYDAIPDFNKKPIDTLTTKVMAIDGFSNKLTEQFINGLEECDEYITKFNKTYKFLEHSVELPKQVGSKMASLTFVPTGFRIKDGGEDGLYRLIVSNGGQIGESINKQTTHVVIKDWDSFKRTDKITKAESNGIKIVTIADVLANKI